MANEIEIHRKDVAGFLPSAEEAIPQTRPFHRPVTFVPEFFAPPAPPKPQVWPRLLALAMVLSAGSMLTAGLLHLNDVRNFTGLSRGPAAVRQMEYQKNLEAYHVQMRQINDRLNNTKEKDLDDISRATLKRMRANKSQD